MKAKEKDIITVKESMSIIEEVWKKYKSYTPKWKAQRIIYICNKKCKKAIDIAIKEAKKEVFDDIERDCITDLGEVYIHQAQYKVLKKHHLSTLEKPKELNYRFSKEK